MEFKKSDCLVIGYDSNEKDFSVLTIMRRRPDSKYEAINSYFGNEADDIYKMLVSRKGAIEV